MNNFPAFNDIENMGGNLETFSFQSALKISIMPPKLFGKISGAISLTGTNTFFSGKSLQNSLDFEEKHENSQNGDIFKTSIKGFIPKLTPEYLKLFEEMVKSKFIVITTDNNGLLRACGNKKETLSFTFERNSTSSPSGLAGHKFEFFGNFTQPSPFYEP